MLGLLERVLVTVVTPDPEDQRIAELLAVRDPVAVERLYDRYGHLAFSLAQRVLGDPAAAEDVVQDAFVSVWRNAASYDPGRAGLRTWLLTIVHRRALDRLRGTRGRSRRDLPLEAAARESGDGEAGFEAVLNALDGEAVRRALASLPEEQRQAIELAYWSGLSQSEISARLGVPLGTVKGRTRLALRRLRTLLSGVGVEWAL